jgi:hypothetical protein
VERLQQPENVSFRDVIRKYVELQVQRKPTGGNKRTMSFLWHKVISSPDADLTRAALRLLLRSLHESCSDEVASGLVQGGIAVLCHVEANVPVIAEPLVRSAGLTYCAGNGFDIAKSTIDEFFSHTCGPQQKGKLLEYLPSRRSYARQPEEAS